MEKKIRVRIAQLKGKGIKKRCRKESRIFLQEYAESEELAIDKLRNKYMETLDSLKSHNFNENIEIFDGEEHIFEGGKCLSQILFPDIFPKENNFKRIKREF